MANYSKTIIFFLLILATVFSIVAFFVPWAGYTDPITNQFASVETMIYDVISTGTYPSELPTELHIYIFLKYFLTYIFRIFPPVLGFLAIMTYLRKKENHTYIYSLSAGTLVIISIVFFYFFIILDAPSYIRTIYGFSVMLEWALGFYLVILAMVLYFVNAGLLKYPYFADALISHNNEKPVRKTYSIKRKEDVDKNKAIQILKIRYVKGEITKEEYEQMKKDIEG